MQLGFVIDHSRCIGCHACSVACKSENDVPIGEFRTWVKYTEAGEFPEVKRSFAVLRCNQCTDAPCMTICPTSALDKLGNGIVDVDPKLCIGCKSCMQGCPYDALYINPSKGTAEKCHFCAHRTERGLAPACAIVCPTEAIIPGDFDDPNSRVSQLKATGELEARKTEAGTKPNVWYREVDRAGIDPALTNGAGGYLWADRQPGAQLDAEFAEAAEARARGAARTTYDVDHKPMWGWKVSLYLWTKAISAGVFLASWASGWLTTSGSAAATTAALAIAFLLITTVLLVWDLKRPERFLLILKHPNWKSWVARGSVVLTAYGGLLGVWLLLGLAERVPTGFGGTALAGLTGLAAALTAMYTAWLLGQAKGRVLWLRRGLSVHLLLHALVLGAATTLLVVAAMGEPDEVLHSFGSQLTLTLGMYLVSTLLTGRLAPHGREHEYGRAVGLLHSGPYAARHKLVLAFGLVLPLTLIVFGGITFFGGASAPVLTLAALLVLAGMWLDGDLFIKAGQALRIS